MGQYHPAVAGGSFLRTFVEANVRLDRQGCGIWFDRPTRYRVVVLTSLQALEEPQSHLDITDLPT